MTNHDLYGLALAAGTGILFLCALVYVGLLLFYRWRMGRSERAIRRKRRALR